MPRIIPRLLKALKDSALTPQNHATDTVSLPRKTRKTSLWQPLPAPCDFSLENRIASPLLDEVNPIINKRLFRRHKRRAATLEASEDQGKCAATDSIRKMSDEERAWHSSPYLRMLASPLRTCVGSSRLLPRDFLIRFAPMKLAVPRSSRPAEVFLPDGLEHPRFKTNKSGAGYYALCLQEVVSSVKERGMYKIFSSNASMPPRTLEYVGHLLRVRILQELQLLFEQLQRRPRGASENPVLRRLTREEFKRFRETNVIPFPNAVALLVVPPVNKNPETKQKPGPHESNQPPPVDDRPIPLKPLPPLSVLHFTEAGDLSSDEHIEGSSRLPRPKVPLYNGLSLFPSRAQRVALHDKLNQVLSAERRGRWREHEAPPTSAVTGRKTDAAGEDKQARGNQKGSHAYLLCSDVDSIQRADSVPLAIALWRLAMWEGRGYSGWDAGDWYLS